MRPAVLTCSFLIAVFASPVQAQQADGFGFRIGVNTSRTSLDQASAGWDELYQRYGIQAAVFGEVPLTAAVAAVAELEYARRGYAYASYSYLDIPPTLPDGVSEDAFRTESRGTTTLHYLSVPALLRVAIPVGGRSVAPYALVGPRADMLLGYRAGSVYIGGRDTEDSLPRTFDTFSVSGVAAGGVELGEPSGRRVRVEVRYGAGLTDVGEGPTEGVRNRGLDFSVAMVF